MIRDPETLEILRDTVNQFVSETLIPRENEVAETNAIPADIIAQMKELGFFGLTIPEEFGGLGLTMEEEVNVAFELGRASPPSVPISERITVSGQSAFSSTARMSRSAIICPGSPAVSCSAPSA